MPILLGGGRALNGKWRPSPQHKTSLRNGLEAVFCWGELICPQQHPRKCLVPFLEGLSQAEPALLTAGVGRLPALSGTTTPSSGESGLTESGGYPPRRASRPHRCIRVLNLVARWNPPELRQDPLVGSSFWTSFKGSLGAARLRTTVDPKVSHRLKWWPPSLLSRGHQLNGETKSGGSLLLGRGFGLQPPWPALILSGFTPSLHPKWGGCAFRLTLVLPQCPSGLVNSVLHFSIYHSSPLNSVHSRAAEVTWYAFWEKSFGFCKNNCWIGHIFWELWIRCSECWPWEACGVRMLSRFFLQNFLSGILEALTKN